MANFAQSFKKYLQVQTASSTDKTYNYQCSCPGNSTCPSNDAWDFPENWTTPCPTLYLGFDTLDCLVNVLTPSMSLVSKYGLMSITPDR